MPRLHSDHTRLAGAERRQLSNALIDAFDVDGLDRMLANQLGKRRQRISLARSLDGMIFDIIEDAEMKSWTAELLAGARAARPTDVALFQLAQTYGIEPVTPLPDLERIVRPDLGLFDPVPWTANLMAQLGRICRVEISATPIRGTGFLVGPDLVLTNHHVVQPVIDWQRQQDGETDIQGQTLPSRLLKCRFDHKILADGVQLNAGEVVGVHAGDWLVDYSPNGNVSFASVPADQLDYALLRLSRPVGDDIIDESDDTRRGWVDLPPLDPELTPETPLFILGHPLGDSMKLSLDSNSVIGLNGPKTRVRYRTNTQAGSSGSPCFTADWTLAALHHAGDSGEEPVYNEGIPMAAIRALWGQRLLGDTLLPWQFDIIENMITG